MMWMKTELFKLVSNDSTTNYEKLTIYITLHLRDSYVYFQKEPLLEVFCQYFSPC
jgi:hypothetical protein